MNDPAPPFSYGRVKLQRYIINFSPIIHRFTRFVKAFYAKIKKIIYFFIEFLPTRF